ncbi:MAG: type II toxin-antitoxin system ParD family antitoxin [Phycisphaerales bacterium]|nr:type II toxin-antitoxin system ParD family antitoxin [Phycisphaerales bacterium]
MSRNISLTPELEEFIQSKVDSRMYQTAGEVAREALRLMARQEQDRQAKLEALKRDVQIGLDQLDRGEYIESKDLTVERIRQGAIKRFGDPTRSKRP